MVRLVLLSRGVEFALIRLTRSKGAICLRTMNIFTPSNGFPQSRSMVFVFMRRTPSFIISTRCFDHPKLVPSEAKDAARMRQIMHIIDGYAYRPLVWGIYVPVYWRDGLSPTEEAIGELRHALGVIDSFSKHHLDACFEAPTLATFYLASVLAAADSVAPGASLIDERPRLREWWNSIRRTPAMIKTRSEHTKF